MYIVYINASNNTPSYTYVSLYVVWRVPLPPPQHLDASLKDKLLGFHVFGWKFKIHLDIFFTSGRIVLVGCTINQVVERSYILTLSTLGNSTLEFTWDPCYGFKFKPPPI